MTGVLEKQPKKPPPFDKSFREVVPALAIPVQNTQQTIECIDFIIPVQDDLIAGKQKEV